MNEIERFLDQVCCGVGGAPELRRHLRKELREHLTEEVARNLAAGLSQEEAVQGRTSFLLSLGCRQDGSPEVLPLLSADAGFEAGKAGTTGSE